MSKIKKSDIETKRLAAYKKSAEVPENQKLRKAIVSHARALRWCSDRLDRIDNQGGTKVKAGINEIYRVVVL